MVMIRRTLLIPVVGVALLIGFFVSNAQADGRQTLVKVDIDLSTFDSVTADAGPGRQFYVEGDICADLDESMDACVGDPIGAFRCWGWQTQSGGPGNVSVVSQEFLFFGQGKIQAQGVEGFGDDSARAIVGGTGRFAKARGEIARVDLIFPPPIGMFIAAFELKGGKIIK